MQHELQPSCAVEDTDGEWDVHWDDRFMALAQHLAGWSKDPSTQVGAVIVDDNRRVRGMGYNGFPRGVNDDRARYRNRDVKYPRVVHAELNAVLEAGSECEGATLYIWPLFSCNECAKAVIQSGIKRVVAPKPAEDRWMSAYDIALEMYREASVIVDFFTVDPAGLALDLLQVEAGCLSESFGGPEEASVHLRARRFLEEAIELAQACGVDGKNAERILRYVYGRPAGEVRQEIGGVGMTLLPLAHLAGISVWECFTKELARIKTPEVMEKIRRRQFEKKDSGL